VIEHNFRPAEPIRGHPPLLDALLSSQDTPDIFPDVVVRAVAEWAKCRFVTLWAHCPLQRALTLVASHPIPHPVSRLEVDRCLSGLALKSKQVTHLADLGPRDGREFLCQELIGRLGLDSAWCVPILNQHNPNDVGLLLTLYPETEFSEDVVRLLPTVGRYVSIAAERILTDRCVRATGAIQEQFPFKTRQEFFSRCLEIILREVDCEAASIFLENATSDRLELAASTGIKWRVPPAQQYYERGHGRTGRLWDESFEYISIGPSPFPAADAPKSEEVCQHPRRSYLFGLIRNESGRAIGVVRCRNKKSTQPAPSEFTDQDGASFSQYDATVLMEICDAMVPRLLLFDAEERAFRSLLKLTHELKMPLVGVKSQLDFIEHEVNQHNLQFREDWIEESRESLNLMGTLVESTEYSVRHRDPRTPPEPFKPVLLLRDIFAPVVDQMAYQLRRNLLPRRSIETGNFLFIPRIWVQPKALSQVVFNLLTNAIKYRFKDTANFRIKISDERSEDHYLIRIQNWGPGIDEREQELVFEMGVRGSAATKYDVSGSGYGLSIAREVMRRHGGELTLTRLAFPTEFTLSFPKSLAQRPPSPTPR
jgi:nitrogen-specific signal transduction histidine kinase